MKNAFITGAETVNAGTKFIIRDTAQLTSGTLRRETVRLVEIGNKAEMPPREKGCGGPPVRKGAVRGVSHLHDSVLPGLCLP